MRTCRPGDPGRRSQPGLRARLAPLVAVVALLAGLGVLVAPAAPSAAVTAPAQGWTTQEAPLPPDAGNGSTNPAVYTRLVVVPDGHGVRRRRLVLRHVRPCVGPD